MALQQTESRFPQALQTSVQIFDLHPGRAKPHHRDTPSNPAGDPPQPNDDQPNAQRLQAIFAALPSGVVVLDARGCVQSCNPAARALLGEPLEGEVWTAVIARAFAPRSDDGHEISLADGRRVSIATCPLSDGQPGQLLLLTDVTETRELQQRLSQHQRLSALGEMAAGLAHQVRTPLATGLLYASQLKRSGLDGDTRGELAQKVVGQLRQLDGLINDMLLFSRIGYGGEERIQAGALLAELEAAVRPHCEERGTRLVLDQGFSDAQLQGNPSTLLSALQNLTANALQALGEGGQLTLGLRDGGCGTLEITVQDDGPGIAADVQAQLFNPFFTTRASGTGLGLAVVQAVAQAHGGGVRVVSRLGEGSEFIVQLPRLEGDA